MGGYSPVGDLTVISICLVMIVLMLFSYVQKSRSFRIFLGIIGLLIFSSLADVGFHILAYSGNPDFHTAARALRCAFHGGLFAIFVLFIAYICLQGRMAREKRRMVNILAWVVFFVVMAADAADTALSAGPAASGEAIVTGGHDVFLYGYLLYTLLVIMLLTYVRNSLYRRVMLSFYGTIAISFLVFAIQRLVGNSSFVVASFLYPVVAMFYLLHSNPYDARIGSIDSRGLQSTVQYNHEKKNDFLFISLFLHDFAEEGKRFPEAIQALIRQFSSTFFRGAMLFQVERGHELLMISPKRNPDYEQRIERILQAFNREYNRFHYDYKIVIGRSIPELSERNEYVSFIHSVHRDIPENCIHWINQDDVKRFNRTEYILRELADIHNKLDLNDPRVLAYCQPVYNIRNRKYDTAEALMRLELPDAGLVFPDQFIPLAEEHGHIHALTKIILNKVCREVRTLMEAGYTVRRVSVNVSALELKDEGFCDDIMKIIEDAGIDGGKIAIELTESQTDSDFLLMKHKISELRERGIKFYLDDFGTGYSNMERIMELPFDIIKFDRSLVQASGANERSRRIVSGLANMFSEMNYSVLYEGVEKEVDESMCEHMFASFLQGYRYSRPVPLEDLKDYFTSDAPEGASGA